MTNRYANKLILKYPAAWWGNMWREALPSGNGIIGAAVYGAVHEETIMITHSDLWHWGIKDELPDVSHTLTETRSLMDTERYDEANWNLTNALEQRGYKTRLASRFPVADIRLTMNGEQPFKQYERSLDMETGQVSVTWKDGDTTFLRRLFVSRAEDIIVYEVTTDGDPIHGILRLAFHPSESPDHWSEECKQLEDTVNIIADREYIYYAGTNDDGTDFGVVARVVHVDGQMSICDEGKGIELKGSSSVLVIAKVFVKSEHQAAWKQLKQELSDINASYHDLLTSHAQLHGRLFNTVELELQLGGAEDNRSNEELLLSAYSGEAPLALIQKMWAYGRYLFISGTHPQGQPFGLYGIWGGDHRLTWDHNMANINIQMIYWHAASGGLIELVPAMIHYYDSMMDDFRENARKLYGCRGIYIPAGSTPGIGIPNQVVPVIMNWTGGAGWIAQHYYEYYLYTGDTAFLREKVLPFMKEVALFYEDFLVIDENGLYKYYPSVSPENTPLNFMSEESDPLDHPMPTAINATSDFAIMKELLSHLVEGSRVAGIYTDKLSKWEEMLNKIPPYQVNENGAVTEWMHQAFDDRYEHRHLSHTYPIFPGREFMREDNPELYKAFETAVKKREIGAQSGWSLIYMAAMYARLGDGNKALECLELLTRSCLLNNFYTLHNDWRNMGVCLDMKEAPVQMDANVGWSSAVQEMLLYVSSTSVKLLPALPDRWVTGRVTNLSFYTGKVSMSWNKSLGEFTAEIKADRHTSLIIYLPAVFRALTVRGDQVSIKRCEASAHAYEIEMEAGQSVYIDQLKDNHSMQV